MNNLFKKVKNIFSGDSSYGDDSELIDVNKIEEEEKNNDIVNTHTAEVRVDKLNISVFTPSEYLDIKQIAIHIKHGHPAVIDLKLLSRADAQKALNFISGLLFAINGSHVKINKSIFLLMPRILKSKVIDEIQTKIITSSFN